MHLKRVIPLMVVTSLLLLACGGTTPAPIISPAAATTPTAATAPVAPSTPRAATAEPVQPFAHTACAAGVDLAGQTVTLYHLVDMQSQQVQPMKAGSDDAAAYFNSHGGICGAS